MTPKQIDLVQKSWGKVSLIADQAADIFYDRLFEVAPETRALFADDMKAQKRALMGMINTAVNGLTRVERLVPTLEAMGTRHAGYGVKAEHYPVVGAALIYTLGKGLGDAFTAEVKDAWTQAYTILAGTMVAGTAKA